MKLSGYCCVRNAIELDYPVHLTIRSLLDVCDEVVVCDSDSTDRTTEAVKILFRSDKLRIINYPWPNPENDPKWFTDWINFTRERLSHPMQLELDADEVLDTSPAAREVIRGAVTEGACRMFNRLNFWRDPRSLIPDGHCCARYVTRIGPSNLWMPSDEPHPEGVPEIVKNAVFHPDLRIFHLGFLRKRESFFKKSRVVQGAFFGSYDYRLRESEADGTPWWAKDCCYLDMLEPYGGDFPTDVKRWLVERGYAS